MTIDQPSKRYWPHPILQMRAQVNGYDCGLHVLLNAYLVLNAWEESQQWLVNAIHIYRHGAYEKLAHVYIGIVPK